MSIMRILGGLGTITALGLLACGSPQSSTGSAESTAKSELAISGPTAENDDGEDNDNYDINLNAFGADGENVACIDNSVSLSLILQCFAGTQRSAGG